MATTVARLEAILSAQTRDFDRAMHRSEGKMKSVGKTAAFVAGGAALGAIGYTLKAGISEWTEHTKVVAQTNAVLKSTHGIANVTSKSVGDLANSLMKKSGVDDEAIQSGENLLLTFKGIRNEAGRNNDIFNQATKATLDLSVAFHKDLNQSAILVGKALNDPVKGMTALRRVGVTLTAQQQEQVKAFVKSGNVIAAQKVILKELHDEVGGSAEAMGKTLPGMISIARESFNNWAGDLVAKMIPVLQRTIAWLRDHWPEIRAKIKEFWDSARPVLTAFGEVIAAAAGAVRRHWNTIGPIVTAVAAVFKNQLHVMAEVLRTIAALLRGDWSQAWQHFRNVVVGMITDIKLKIQAEAKILIAVMSGLGTAMKEAAVAGLRGIANALMALINPAVGSVKTVVSGLWGTIRSGAETVIKPILAVAHAFGKILTVLRKIIDGIRWLINKIPDIPHPSIPFVTGGGGDISMVDELQLRRVAQGNRSIDRRLWPAIGLGRMMGLGVVSGYRPGATVRGSGARSDHSYYPSKAVDLADSPRQMGAFAARIAGQPGIDTVIYSPIGLWKAGVGWGPIRSGITKADHYSHVHVDTFDKGGLLRTGLTLARNDTGNPEAIVPLPKKGTDWRTWMLQFMQRVWGVAGSYFNRGGAPMPKVNFIPWQGALGIGSAWVTEPGVLGKIPGLRTVNIPGQVYNALQGIRDISLRGNAKSLRNWALSLLIHEWAHVFQKEAVFNRSYVAEGGAEGFAQMIAPRVYGALGIPFERPSSGTYQEFVDMVKKKYGLQWILWKQFQSSPLGPMVRNFDRGGYLQPGVTLAVNNTGRPERVGGETQIVNVNVDGNTIATVVFDRFKGKARVFQRQNGRPAFGF